MPIKPTRLQTEMHTPYRLHRTRGERKTAKSAGRKNKQLALNNDIDVPLGYTVTRRMYFDPFHAKTIIFRRGENKPSGFN